MQHPELMLCSSTAGLSECSASYCFHSIISIGPDWAVFVRVTTFSAACSYNCIKFLHCLPLKLQHSPTRVYRVQTHPGIKQLGYEADHSLHLLPRLSVCSLPALPRSEYFEYKIPSNLRCTQPSSVGFKGESWKSAYSLNL
jgi:hypothetical protein